MTKEKLIGSPQSQLSSLEAKSNPDKISRERREQIKSLRNTLTIYKQRQQTINLDKQVLQLRNDKQNFTNEEIAQKLFYSLGAIRHSIHRLLDKGLVTRRERQGPSISQKIQTRTRDEEIIKLRNQKPELTNEQIAEKLNLSMLTLSRYVHRLIETEKIKKRSDMPKTERETECGIETIKDRDKYIQKLREEGFTDAEIAKKLGRSLTTVNRSVQRLIKEGKIIRRS